MRTVEPGFTLIELLVVLAIAAVFAAIALPNHDAVLRKARRADALTATAQIQLAQERLRSRGPRYGSLAEIGAPTVTSAGHYTLEMRRFDATGYELLVSAIGTQARDTDCRFMALRANELNLLFSSGPDASVANADPINRRCWSL